MSGRAKATHEQAKPRAGRSSGGLCVIDGAKGLGKVDSHNLLFVDGSVHFIRMKSRSGRTKDYTVYPFRDVNELLDRR